MADVIQASQYLRRMDLTCPYNSDVITFLIPVPDETMNISAVIKPFQWPVKIKCTAFCDYIVAVSYQ